MSDDKYTLPFVSNINNFNPTFKEQHEKDVEVCSRFHDKLKEYGFCFIEVLQGDYKGSIAKFSLTESLNEYKISWNGNVKTCWSGRLSWGGRRNNPKFNITSRSCCILPDYEGETHFVKFDLNKKKTELLRDISVTDIRGNKLNIDDSIIYMNLRYGCGGKLSFGKIVEFKANARQGYISVVVENELEDERSELHYPHNQIYLTDK